MIKELTGKHVLIIFLTFFGVIFIMNGFFVYFSQSSWTGLETRDAYRKGLKYNQQLSRSEAQNTRGWTMSLKKEDLPGGGFSLTAVPRTAKGETITRLDLSVELKRPTHEGIDQKFTLKETGLGIYSGKVGKQPLGKWYLLVTARKGSEVMYRSKNELYLK